LEITPTTAKINTLHVNKLLLWTNVAVHLNWPCFHLYDLVTLAQLASDLRLTRKIMRMATV
jgi:hypothetical protein